MSISQEWVFRAMCLGHFIVDFFNTMGPVLLAFISGHVMGLSNTQIGLAVSGYQIAGAFSQPLFGLRADRTGGRWLAAGGVLWTLCLLCVAMLGAASGQYWAMVVPFVLAAFGSGAFHPIGAMYASITNREKAAHYTSLFFLSGQLGGGSGPLVIGLLLDQFSTRNNSFTAILGPNLPYHLMEHGTLAPVLALSLLALPGIVLLLLATPSRVRYLGTQPPRSATVGASAAPLAGSLIVYLAVNIALRALANPGSAAFIPRIFQLKGWPASEYGMLSGLFWLSGGIAGVFFARWASRFGSRAVIGLTLILGGPLMLVLPSAESVPLAMLMTVLVGALTGGSHSLLVVMAQQLLPARRGFVSGLALGYMFGMGAIGTLLIGTLADRVGVAAAFQMVGLVTVLAGAMALRLPSDEQLVARARAAAAPADLPDAAPLAIPVAGAKNA